MKISILAYLKMNTFMTMPLIRGTYSNAAWMIHRPSESVCCIHTVYMQNIHYTVHKVSSYRHIIIIEALNIYNGHSKLSELKLSNYVYYILHMAYTVLIFSIYIFLIFIMNFYALFFFFFSIQITKFTY